MSAPHSGRMESVTIGQRNVLNERDERDAFAITLAAPPSDVRSHPFNFISSIIDIADTKQIFTGKTGKASERYAYLSVLRVVYVRRYIQKDLNYYGGHKMIIK